MPFRAWSSALILAAAAAGKGQRSLTPTKTPAKTGRMKVVIVTHQLLRQDLMKQSVCQWKQGPVDLYPKDSCYALSHCLDLRVNEIACQIVKLCAVRVLFDQSVNASLFVHRHPCWRVCCLRAEDRLVDVDLLEGFMNIRGWSDN
jgi:hypothetical protein